jgi:phosphate transport system ATP-binding protein
MSVQMSAAPRGAERAPRPPKIAIRNLDFFYGATRALMGLSLDIPANAITALIGPSGCGKSTLLRAIDRLDGERPGERCTGEIRLDGANIFDPAFKASALHGRIGMIFQAPAVFPMSIEQNIAFAAKVHFNLEAGALQAHVRDCLIKAGLWDEVKDHLKHPAADLSGGQKQRLCVARALATRPEVLLLDEPTGSLDPYSMRKIEDLMLSLKDHVALVLVTHNLPQAARCADKVAFMTAGTVVEEGAPEAVLLAPAHPAARAFVGAELGGRSDLREVIRERRAQGR